MADLLVTLAGTWLAALASRAYRRAVSRILKEWAATIPARFAELAGGGPTLELSGFSDKGIPHWHAELTKG